MNGPFIFLHTICPPVSRSSQRLQHPQRRSAPLTTKRLTAQRRNARERYRRWRFCRCSRSERCYPRRRKQDTFHRVTRPVPRPAHDALDRSLPPLHSIHSRPAPSHHLRLKRHVCYPATRPPPAPLLCALYRSDQRCPIVHPTHRPFYLRWPKQATCHPATTPPPSPDLAAA